MVLALTFLRDSEVILACSPSPELLLYRVPRAPPAPMWFPTRAHSGKSGDGLSEPSTTCCLLLLTPGLCPALGISKCSVKVS